MFAATKNNHLINLQAVVSIAPASDNDGSLGVLANGDMARFEDNMEVLEAMRCLIIPAHPGFFRLVHRFEDDLDTIEKQPVIAWRIRTPFAPEAITPEEDFMSDLALTEGILYPDGKVVIGDTGRFDDITAWLGHAHEERAQWKARQT